MNVGHFGVLFSFFKNFQIVQILFEIALEVDVLQGCERVHRFVLASGYNASEINVKIDKKNPAINQVKTQVKNSGEKSRKSISKKTKILNAL